MKKILSIWLVICICLVAFNSTFGIKKVSYFDSVDTVVSFVNNLGTRSRKLLLSTFGISVSTKYPPLIQDAYDNSPIFELAHGYYNDLFWFGVRDCPCEGKCVQDREKFIYNIYYSDARFYLEDSSFMGRVDFETRVLGSVYYNPFKSFDDEVLVIYQEGKALGYSMDNPFIFNDYEPKYEFICPYANKED